MNCSCVSKPALSLICTFKPLPEPFQQRADAPIIDLHEDAIAVSLSGLRRTRTGRAAEFCNCILRRPHGPVTSADAHGELVGNHIGENAFELHPFSDAPLWRYQSSEYVVVSSVECYVRQIGNVSF